MLRGFIVERSPCRLTNMYCFVFSFHKRSLFHSFSCKRDILCADLLNVTALSLAQKSFFLNCDAILWLPVPLYCADVIDDVALTTLKSAALCPNDFDKSTFKGL